MTDRGRLTRRQRKRRKVEQMWADADQAQYYISSGLRLVAPYEYSFQSFAKGRWLGRTLIEVFSDEFVAFTRQYYEQAILQGRITVNDNKIPLDYCLQSNDYIVHTTHRHELPVLDRDISYEEYPDQGVVIVVKPASVPIHPSGRYHFNSLVYLMAHCYGIRLFPVHRLDRLTSGLCVFATDRARASELAAKIRQRDAKKYYIARVQGRFQSDDDGVVVPDVSPDLKELGVADIADQEEEKFQWIDINQPIKCIDKQKGRHTVSNDAEAKESRTWVCRLRYDEDSDTSMVLCRLFTGRTHQIRVHLQWSGFPIANDPCYGGIMCRGNSTISDLRQLPEEVDKFMKQYRQAGCKDCDWKSSYVVVESDKESMLYCSEIWLHALRYEFPSSESGERIYTTGLPEWACVEFDTVNYLRTRTGT